MPDVGFFREGDVQKRLCEILFVFCKQNMDTGYRQGFHEIAAVALWVVYQDKVDLSAVEDEDCGPDEDVMREALDAAYINHDAYALFNAIMASAKAWYALGGTGGSSSSEQMLGNSPIVQKSKYIHETLLMVTDPELSEHLKALDVLPQVFLM
jgi:TBC1 domain family protein 5